MSGSFSEKEKRRYLLRKHIKNHLLEYIMDIVGPFLLTMLVLYLCKAERPLYGAVLSLAYSVGKLIYRLYHYKKEYLDIK